MSHLANIAWTSASQPFFTTASIRSCDSESNISYGCISAWRLGTLSKSMRIPHPPFSDISDVLQIIPAAPMSCIPTSAFVLASSNVASINTFSANGSPTCTEGISFSDSSVTLADANVAPCIPSLPVADPTMKTGFPSPRATADIISPTRTKPTDIAFTSGFVS